ncbi:2-isopropylmalate synthase [Streptosporangium sp. NBC_01469]|uniref:2-isopropylmalate synthase n=1 Tax=Streptosporangium sp. NBC_01469 TaxID=2903898 RepID=UPI002E281407|nr:2-isopropylmalate synthase [Streptosporangium sp. NBC_01469]
MKISRYPAFPLVPLDDRRWPGATVGAPPRWLSTDLRDGNQSMPRPMDLDRKLVFFDLLVAMGYKEIEIGFPAASRDDHDFVRLLIERERIPDDVCVSVLTQARDELIERTVASLRGAPRALLHLYSATSPVMRRLVFGMDRDECRNLAVRGARLVVEHAGRLLDGCDLRFQYSPEHFQDTEPDFSLELCEAVMDVWQPGPDRPIILNLPTTVERSTPNVFADQIEWMHRNLSRRQHLCLSVHPHNDRGTGVAAAELAVLAGAERIEGCLFGNGERAGNVCLVTLGLNLAAQGIDPGIDFTDLDRVRRVVEECTGLPVPPRHPYGGDLVFTAFSGGHQDAIKKAFDAMDREAARTGTDHALLPWEVPYLPVDPHDIGRTYEAVVRVTSQSGKAGPAYLLSSRYGFDLPRGLQIEFAQAVQALTEGGRGEIAPERIREVFEEEYLRRAAPPFDVPGAVVTLHIDGHAHDDGPGWTRAVAALRAAFHRGDVRIRVVHHVDEAARAPGGRVAVYAECELNGGDGDGDGDGDGTVWGVGVEDDVAGAALAAVGSAVARAAARGSAAALPAGGGTPPGHGREPETDSATIGGEYRPGLA